MKHLKEKTIVELVQLCQTMIEEYSDHYTMPDHEKMEELNELLKQLNKVYKIDLLYQG